MEGITWISTRGDAQTFVYLLMLIVFSLTLGTFAMIRYRRWLAHQRFMQEMRQLCLTELEQQTFADLVVHHIGAEPIHVLYSLPVFDRIASQEIERVLASNASRTAKEAFIDHVYSIRLKTYFSADEEQVVL